MKKVLFALFLFICSDSTAEDIDSNLQCIAISQSFIGQGECKPSFGSSKFYYNKEDINNLLIDTNCIVTNRAIGEYDEQNGCFKTNDKTISKIIVKSFIKGMANDGNALFSYDLSNINIGVNLKTVQASDP